MITTEMIKSIIEYNMEKPRAFDPRGRICVDP